MKPTPWIFPGIAVLVAGAWIASRKHAAAALEREITAITERVSQAEGTEKSSSDAAARAAQDRKIDWKNLSGTIVRSGQGDLSKKRAMIRLQLQLMELSVAELSAHLDAIAALELDDSARKQLQFIVLRLLAEKDPRVALDRCKDELGNDDQRFGWLLSSALGTWAEKDPTAAAAWLDQQIAAGKLDSKALDGSIPRWQLMESAIVSQLMKSDPAAASARVGGLPEDQRQRFLNDMFHSNCDKELDATNAKIVRDNLSAEKAADSLGFLTCNLAARGGYERVDSFITSIAATDAEKIAIAEGAMKVMVQDNDPKVAAEQLGKARDWAASHVPDAVDETTGRVLAHIRDFYKASELALEFNGRAGNDQVLATFLKNRPQLHNVYQARVADLLEHIKDSALREEIRNLPQYQK